jgi:hypothetical protein
MTITPVNALIQDVLAYQYNPASIQRAVLKKLTEATNGALEVVDPTNPFVFCLESAAVLTAAAMTKTEVCTRKQYPIAAQTQQDLYPHMSDLDYVNRFATPSNTKFSLLLPLEEVLVKMVEDQSTGMRKLVIPRNTFFTVAGVNFSLQYPIEIRQLAHGGLQVVYDAEKLSPLQTLSTNIINFEIRRNIDSEWIYFEFDVLQFDIISRLGQLDSSGDFKLGITIADQYYYTRVYVEGVGGRWVEIYTTHSDQIYDNTSPTAVLNVVDNVVNVSIPQIYTSSLLLNKGIRIDVYQTKGPLDMVLFDYSFSAFAATWQSYDKEDETVFSAPLKAFRTIIPFSDKVVSGGTNVMSFNDLRSRVINNSIGIPSLPITNAQIEGTLSLAGYGIVKNVDSITNRVFLATKPMPNPVNTNLITAAAASIFTLSTTMDALVQLDTVKNNGSSITITPDTLYKTEGGVTTIVPDAIRDALLAMPVDKRALVVTGGGFLYTPFHYVLDTSDNTFDCRPYYLDSPEIETKLFVSENDTTLLQVGTENYSVTRTRTGYEVIIITKSNESFKALSDAEVFVQMAYVPAGEKDRAYLNGHLIGLTETKERIYSFNLNSNFNVTKDDDLSLNSFLLYTLEPRITNAALVTEFDIIYSTSISLGSQWKSGAIDSKLGKFLLPDRIAGITNEIIRVRFGSALKTLWSRARSVIDSVPYKTWPENVPRYYESDIYLRDANGATITIDVHGNAVSTLLHSKGDPVLLTDGTPSFMHLKGDIILDGSGNPVTTDLRGMLRQIDLMLIEGAYWFATDATATKYRSTMTQVVVDWLTNDIAAISTKLLEKSHIYFYPKTTLGVVNVMVNDGVIKSIAAGQAFVVDLFVSGNVYSDIPLRTQITKATIKKISELLDQTTIAVDNIETALKGIYGLDVISIKLSGLGDTANLQALTIMDDGDRCSIRKRLVALPDNTLYVEEDITVNFIRHQIKLN